MQVGFSHTKEQSQHKKADIRTRKVQISVKCRLFFIPRKKAFPIAIAKIQNGSKTQPPETEGAVFISSVTPSVSGKCSSDSATALSASDKRKRDNRRLFHT